MSDLTLATMWFLIPLLFSVFVLMIFRIVINLSVRSLNKRFGSAKGLTHNKERVALEIDKINSDDNLSVDEKSKLKAKVFKEMDASGVDYGIILAIRILANMIALLIVGKIFNFTFSFIANSISPNQRLIMATILNDMKLLVLIFVIIRVMLFFVKFVINVIRKTKASPIKAIKDFLVSLLYQLLAIYVFNAISGNLNHLAIIVFLSQEWVLEVLDNFVRGMIEEKEKTD